MFVLDCPINRCGRSAYLIHRWGTERGRGCPDGCIPFCLLVDGMLARATHMNEPACLIGEFTGRATGGGGGVSCQVHLGKKKCVGCTHDSGCHCRWPLISHRNNDGKAAPAAIVFVTTLAVLRRPGVPWVRWASGVAKCWTFNGRRGGVYCTIVPFIFLTAWRETRIMAVLCIACDELRIESFTVWVGNVAVPPFAVVVRGFDRRAHKCLSIAQPKGGGDN